MSHLKVDETAETNGTYYRKEDESIFDISSNEFIEFCEGALYVIGSHNCDEDFAEDRATYNNLLISKIYGQGCYWVVRRLA